MINAKMQKQGFSKRNFINWFLSLGREAEQITDFQLEFQSSSALSKRWET